MKRKISLLMGKLVAFLLRGFLQFELQAPPAKRDKAHELLIYFKSRDLK